MVVIEKPAPPAAKAWPGGSARLLAGLLVLAFTLGSATAADTNTQRRVQFREPRASAYLLDSGGATNGTVALRPLTTGTGHQSWTRARLADGSTNTVELGSRVVLELDPGRHLESFLAGRSLSLARTVGTNLFILQAEDSAAAIAAAEALAKEEGVVASYPVMRRPLRRHGGYAPAPNDPYFDQQWHLENRGSDRNLAGPDLNVRAAWPVTHGEGILVAVADDGFQLTHPELTTRAGGAPHYNFYLGTSSGGPGADDANHATAVAGLIAAEQNNQKGVTGVAPKARLASWVIFGKTASGFDDFVSDEQLMDMFQYASNRVSVQNHSWGDASGTQSALDALSNTAIGNAVTKGRGGLGVVMVRAAGNYRETAANANDDGFANDPRAIAVAAVRKDGRICSYSSPGACVLVGAPSGDTDSSGGDGDPMPDVYTTDRTGAAGYTPGSDDGANYCTFNGTSASSPQVAGVVALVLSANTNLTYRDVQHILVQSARHYDFADPALRTNGAGFRVSHNVGFGVPDAAVAVDLARSWSNLPAAKRVTVETTKKQAIPDDSLRVVCAGTGISEALTSIHCLPSLGAHPDTPTGARTLVDVGQANDEIAEDLTGKAALIERGTSLFSEKIARAARAGAVFAVIFNNTGATEIQEMGGTTSAPIPAVAIGKSDGDALRNYLATNPDATAKLLLIPTVYRLSVTDTLACEHVGLRLTTTHTSRQDVRVTLVSPMGTRSVMQAINEDTSAGPTDWTYWSTQHFYESSVGEWRVEVSDERATTVSDPAGGSKSATGSVTYVQLIVDGLPITDTDHDGLDDNWERKWFGDLRYGPKDDPDDDGYNNAREQVLGTDPTTPNTAFRLEYVQLESGYWRFTWPSREGDDYTLLSSSDLRRPFNKEATVPGQFPLTEHVLPTPGGAERLFEVRAEAP